MTVPIRWTIPEEVSAGFSFWHVRSWSCHHKVHFQTSHGSSPHQETKDCGRNAVSPKLAGQVTPISAAPAAAGHTQQEDATNMLLDLYHQQQEESGDMPYLPGSPLPDSPNLSQSTAGGIASSVENSGSQDTTGIVAWDVGWCCL